MDRIYPNTRVTAAAIVFDVASIYNELALPLDQRRIPAFRLLADESVVAFKEWEAKPDKVRY